MTLVTGGQGLAHATASRPLSPAREATISARWDLWIPRAIVIARADPAKDPIPCFEALRQRHRTAVLTCQAAGLPWTTIVRQALDDPQWSESKRARMIREAVERRRCRMGRVKGQGKGR